LDPISETGLPSDPISGTGLPPDPFSGTGIPLDPLSGTGLPPDPISETGLPSDPKSQELNSLRTLYQLPIVVSGRISTLPSLKTDFVLAEIHSN